MNYPFLYRKIHVVLFCLISTLVSIELEANTFSITHSDIGSTPASPIGTVDFGTVAVGANNDITITFQNGENVDTLDTCATYNPSGKFEVISQTCGNWNDLATNPFSNLAPNNGSSCDVQVRYTPTGGTSDSSNFRLYCNDSSYNGNTRPSFFVSLSGTVQQEAPAITQASPVSVVMSENGSPTNFNLTLNATDINNDTLTWSISSNASHGVASVSGTGLSKAISYTPDADYDGSDSFVVQVSDGNGGTDTVAVNVTINNVNKLPTATAQNVNTDEDTNVAITLSGNDSDGNISSYAVGTPSNGSLSGVAPNLVYTPNPEYSGADSFTFTVTDNDGGVSAAAAVNINIASVNDLPVADGQSLETLEDTSLTITLSGNDIDGTIESYQVTPPANGALSGTAPALTYIPNENFYGSDSFTYSVNDNNGGESLAATINIEVASVNDIPTATGQSVQLNEDDSIAIVLFASDIDGTITNYTVSSPANGTLSGTPPYLTYTPTPDFNGSDEFTFRAIDNDGAQSNTQTIDIAITPVNDAPLAQDDTFEFNKNGENQYAMGVLSNDTDIENETLTISTASADIGTVSIDGDQLIFTAPPGFIGSLTIRYVVVDESGSASDATVALTIVGNFDEIAPTITLPENVEVNATALYTKVDLGVATALDANGNTLPVSLVDNNVLFPPGISKAYWQATDADGNQSISAQEVQVHPLVSIGKDQTIAEGNTVTVNFYLNGPSPSYPVIVAYSVSGSAEEGTDHNLTAGEVEIGRTNTASIAFETYDDSVADGGENIVITIADSVNVSPQATQIVQLTEDNIAPEVVITAMHAEQQRAFVSQSDGLVTVMAQINDQNVADTHTLVWSSTSDNLSLLIDGENTNSVTFDAADLPVGIHKLAVVVEDSGQPSLVTQAEIYIEVVAALAELSELDSDGDLITDILEGYGDRDSDGIADYLDAINDCNVMPHSVTSQTNFLVESEPGVCLRKGSTAPQTQSGSLLLTSEETLQAVGQDEEAEIVGGIVDFIVYGLENTGQSYKLVLPQRQPIPEGAIYRKYIEGFGWGNFLEDADNALFSTQGEPGFCPPPGSQLWQSGLTGGHWCVQLQIADGGPNDSDGIANGSIVDPGGVAVILNTNTDPLAENDSVTILWNENLDIDVLSNDSDADGDALSILNASAQFGSVDVLNDSLLSYTPPLNYVGVDTISYVISDGNSGIASAQVTIEIIGNSLPEAIDDSAATDDRTTITVDVIANDKDTDGDNLTLLSVLANSGTATIVENKILYTPALGFDGTDTVTYTITDGKGGEASATLAVSVDAFESITVVNKSKSSGGSMSMLALVLIPLLLLRRRGSSKLIKTIILAATFVSLPSMANWQIKGSIGTSKADISIAELNQQLAGLDASVSTLDDSGSTFALAVGYKFENNWMFDIGYIDLGQFSAEIEGMTLDPNAFQETAKLATPSSANGVTIGAGYQHHFSTDWSMTANIGLFTWENNNESSSVTTEKSSDSGTDFFYGIAIGYQVSPSFGVDVNYNIFNLDQHDINALAVGLTYTF